MFKVACVQTNSTSNIDENIERVSSLITDSAKAGANLVLVPENVTMMEAKNSNAFIKSKLEKDHPAVPIFKQLARRLKIFLLIGSLAIKKSSRSKMIFNRSMFINDKGEIIARYDKIHMFDVQLKNNESYSESKIYQAGNDAGLRFLIPKHRKKMETLLLRKISIFFLYSFFSNYVRNLLCYRMVTLTHWFTCRKEKLLSKNNS